MSMRTLQTRGSLALGALLACLCASPSAALPGNAIELAAEENEPALVMRNLSGGVALVSQLQVYASGTAVLQTWLGERLVSEDSSVLPDGAIEGMLHAIAAGRLLDFDDAQVGEQVRRLSGSPDPFAPSDSSYFVVKMAVEETTEGGSAVTRRKEISIQAPETLARRFPAIREYQALAQLKEILEAHQRARGARP